jgi:phosphonate transport system substrate-binding protein
MKKTFAFVFAALLIASMILSACATTEEETPEVVVTEAPVVTEEPEAAIGSPEHPIKVLFVPSVDAAEIIAGGELLAQTLNEATGLTFEVIVPTSYAATIEEMCASPADTMGFIPGLGYVLANQVCGVEVAAKAVRFGYTGTLQWWSCAETAV